MIHLSNISKSYGNKVLYKNGHFQINAGEKIGLVGPNGAGKSTIFRLITGEESPDDGQISKPQKTVVGYFSQNIEEMSGKTVLEEVLSANGQLPQIEARLKHLEAQLSEPLDDDTMAKVLEEYGDLQGEFERQGGYEAEARAKEVLSGLGIPASEQTRDTSTFSGGWKMRIALAKILVLQPDALLMDEPTNHLDMESILWLEQWLVQFKGSILMTSHDRDFMNRIVGKIVEVAHQSITVYSGNYDFYEKEKVLRKEQLLAAARRQEDMLAKEKEFIARFAARASHAAQVQSRVKKIEKIDIIEIPEEEESIRFEWPNTPRGGDEVLKFEKLTKFWKTHDGKDHLVFENAAGLVKRQDRVAVVGVNGAGKSTLMKIVTGQAEPTSGTYQIGASIEVGYFSQNSIDILNPELTIFDEIANRIPQATVGHIRNLLGSLKFSGDEVEKRISILSGGEKSRVVLATILSRAVNFLVLDEPTNHLDIDSREVLLDAIKRFSGTVMIVSHDRHFLREITTKVFELDKNHLTIVEGSWDYYIEKRGHQLFAREH